MSEEKEKPSEVKTKEKKSRLKLLKEQKKAIETKINALEAKTKALEDRQKFIVGEAVITYTDKHPDFKVTLSEIFKECVTKNSDFNLVEDLVDIQAVADAIKSENVDDGNNSN